MSRSSNTIRKWFVSPGGLVSCLLAVVVLATACAVFARTRSFPDVPPNEAIKPGQVDFVDRFACLIEEAPLASHVTHESGANTGVFGSSVVVLNSSRSVMVRYDISAIPRGMRITNAELEIPVTYFTPADARFFVYRVLQDWGQGTSYKYRLRTPEQKIEWASPGARGGSSDRATGATASYRVKKAGKIILNVTSDVEMWYTKTAQNFGWLFAIEELGSTVMFTSPTYHGSEPWRLRVTYEPE